MLILQKELELSAADQDAVDVELAVSGDASAFERLYRRHVGRTASMARWLLGHDDVDDVLQDVFIRVWEKLSTFQGQAAFKTWLHRVATNVILRSRQTRRTWAQRHAGSDVRLQDTPGDRSTPGLRVDMEMAVARLPERARRVFVLHDMAGYKHEEIAAELDISPGTSRSQLHHARMALREYFESGGG